MPKAHAPLDRAAEGGRRAAGRTDSQDGRGARSGVDDAAAAPQAVDRGTIAVEIESAAGDDVADTDAFGQGVGQAHAQHRTEPIVVSPL